VRRYLILGVVLTSLVIIPLGAAGTSLMGAYGGSGSNPVVNVEGATAASKTEPASLTTSTAPTGGGTGTLPFTGTDLSIFVAVGIGLLALGAGLRRLGRNES